VLVYLQAAHPIESSAAAASLVHGYDPHLLLGSPLCMYLLQDLFAFAVQIIKCLILFSLWWWRLVDCIELNHVIRVLSILS